MATKAILFLLFSVVMATYGDSEDQELQAIFNDLEKQLNYKQEIKDLIGEVKKEVAKTPSITTRTLGMAKALNLAVPKLQSTRGVDIAQGILNVVSGIAENLPFGQFIAPLASLVSSIIGIVSGATIDNTIQEFIQDVVRQESDHELESKAMSSKQELTTAFNYLISKHSQALDQADVTRLITQVPITTGVGILGLLEGRIGFRSTTQNKDAAKQCYKFCLLYAQIATIRDLVINDVIFLIRKAGDTDEAKSYETVKSNFKNSYQNALKFLHSPQVAQTATVSYYYPPGHDEQSKYLQNFTRIAGIRDPAPLVDGSKFVLLSVQWPRHHAKMIYTSYVIFGSGSVPDWTQVTFTRRSDGYYELKYQNEWLRMDPSYPTYVRSTTNKPTKNPYGHFIVIKYPGKNIITIANRKYRGKFLKGESGTVYMRMRDDYTGTNTQFYIKKCNRIYNSGTGSWFCDKLP